METYDPHKNTTETRQGDRRLTNIRVLVIAMVVLAVAFAIIWFVFAMQTPPGT
jgi:flagellar basal body-associated protein FliL